MKKNQNSLRCNSIVFFNFFKYIILYDTIYVVGDFMNLENLDLKSLKKLKSIVSDFDSIESLISQIDSRISSLEDVRKDSLNVRFNLEMFIRLKIFDPSEFKVIRDNNINNLQELIDCDLDSLVGITPSIKEGLSWVRSAYDMSSFEEDEEHHVK